MEFDDKFNAPCESEKIVGVLIDNQPSSRRRFNKYSYGQNFPHLAQDIMFGVSCTCVAPARVLSYHAGSSRYIALTSLLLNHYACVHEQYTPHGEANTPTPNLTPTPEQYARQQVQRPAVLLFHVHT